MLERTKKKTQIETAERNRQIKHLALEGKTPDEIASIVGIKRYRVMQILRSYKIKAARVPHTLHCEKAQAIVKELQAGTKQIEIARKLNVSRQYVNQIKNTWNIIKETH